MKEELIEKMSKTGRLKLSFWKSASHYWPVIFIFSPPLYISYSLLEIYVFDTYDGMRSADELTSGMWIWIVIGIIVWFIQWNRLRFRILETSISPEEFSEALSRTSKELNWRITDKKKFSFRAYRRGDFMSSWGEMITIFFKDNKLYINAIPDLDQPSTLTTLGWCKKNRDTFVKNLIDVKEKIPETKRIEESGFATKWTFWSVVVRIFIYPLALGFIILGSYIIYDGGNLLIAGVLIAVAGTFLFTDIKIMFGSKRSITPHKSNSA